MNGSRRIRPVVTGDGAGIVGQSGGLLLIELVDVTGLTTALTDAFQVAPRRRSQDCRGVVLRDMSVAVALGGDCLADLAVLRDNRALFGPVASDPTAWRTLAAADATRLAASWNAARAAAWKAGARPAHRFGILDIDATLVTAPASARSARCAGIRPGTSSQPAGVSVGEIVVRSAAQP